MDQLSFADMEISLRQKRTKLTASLTMISNFVNWSSLLSLVQILDKSKTGKGGRKPLSMEVKLRMLFLQHLYNISDEQLEEQIIDRYSFQQFCGLNMSESIPDFTTFWRFKEALVSAGLSGKIFGKITDQLESKGMILNKGTVVDATLVHSSNRPLSKEKRSNLLENPSTQIDTDAKSTEKNGKKYFGYKGHIGVDVGSKLIHHQLFTAASVHDSQPADQLWSGKERSKFGDKAYTNQEQKSRDRKSGIFHGILDKATRSRKLSGKQIRRNQLLSSIRSCVEHPFAFMKSRLHYRAATRKNRQRNELVFVMNCIVYNVRRALFLERKLQIAG